MATLQFQYTQLNTKYIEFGPITDSLNPNVPITDATVTASLWRARAPGRVSGFPVIQLSQLDLPHIGGGVYRGLMSDVTFNPPTGSDYLTVIELTTPGNVRQHWEIPSNVVARIPGSLV